MSPGGLFSAAFGFGARRSTRMPLEPQPATPDGGARRGALRLVRFSMAATVGPPPHRPARRKVNARSKLAGIAVRARLRVPAMTGPGSCWSRTTTRSPSGLVRVLEGQGYPSTAWREAARRVGGRDAATSAS